MYATVIEGSQFHIHVHSHDILALFMLRVFLRDYLKVWKCSRLKLPLFLVHK